MVFGLVYWFLLCVYSHVESCTTCNSRSSLRIMGGRPADIKDFPYQLILEVFNQTIFPHKCGAAIIHPSWAISAAHCIYLYSEAQVRLRSGSSNINTGGTVHSVSKIVIHPKYYSNVYPRNDYDICILKVSTPFQYSNVTQAIPMATKTPSPGSRAVVSGWGYVNYELETSDQLQQLVVYIMDFQECKGTDFYLVHRLTPRMLCARAPGGGKNIYLGDSGAPLVVNNTLVGIVSLIIKYHRVIRYQSFPGVYTDVAKMHSWVTSTIERESIKH